MIAPLSLKHSLPVMLGYIPLGMAFGVLFQSLGYAWWLAPVSGIMIYAGSAQFLAVGLLASGAGLQSLFSFNSEGFEFSMLALFLVLLIDRLRQLQHVPHTLYAVAVVVVSW